MAPLLVITRYHATCQHLNDAGGLRKHLEYDSFGNIGAQTWYSAGGPSYLHQWFYFTGQESDKDTALHNYNARWYDPKLGRFLSEDPTDFDAGDPQPLRRKTAGTHERATRRPFDSDLSKRWNKKVLPVGLEPTTY